MSEQLKYFTSWYDNKEKKVCIYVQTITSIRLNSEGKRMEEKEHLFRYIGAESHTGNTAIGITDEVFNQTTGSGKRYFEPYTIE